MTKHDEPVDPRQEQVLAAALQAEAQTVRPAGDGLVRIRARVGRPRARPRMLVPLAALASTAAVAASVTAVLATGVLAGSHRSAGSNALPRLTVTPAATTPRPVPRSAPVGTRSAAPFRTSAAARTTAEPTPARATTTAPTSAPVTVARAGRPAGRMPVWPFADAAAAAAWQSRAAGDTANAWRLDPRATAEHFIGLLRLRQMHMPRPQLAEVLHPDAVNGSASVDVSRLDTVSGRPVVIGTVQLAHWTAGADAPWGVVGITAPTGSQLPLTITSPAPGDGVTSPLAVSYTMTGAEDDVFVSAWAAGATTPLGVQPTVTGTGRTTVVDADLPASGLGFVAVADGSAASGSFQLSRLAVMPVRFDASSAPATSYVAVVSGRLEVRDATSDAVLRHLASGQGDVSAATVSEDGRWVYYLSPGRFSRARLDGTGAAITVAAGASCCASIAAFDAAGPGATHLAYAISTEKGGQLVVFGDTRGFSQGGITVGGSMPPNAETVSLSRDGQRLSAFVRTGNQGNVVTFDLATARTLGDGVTPGECTAAGAGCVGAAYAPNGDLLLVRSSHGVLSVLRLRDGLATSLFSVPGTSRVAHVDVDATGLRMLLTDGEGHGWSWANGGSARALPGHVSDASW